MKAQNLLATLKALSLCPLCENTTYVKTETIQIQPFSDCMADAFTIYCPSCDYEVVILQD